MVADVVALWPFVAALVGAVLLLGAVSLLVGGSRFRFRSGNVNGVVGELGGGKSMFVVSRVLAPAARALASRRGLTCLHTGRKVRQIITNFTFEPERLGIKGATIVQLAPAEGITIWEQIIAQGRLEPDPFTGELELRIDALVAIDEMSLFVPSDEQRIHPLAKSFFVHARKWNCEVWWMAQDTGQVHKRVRKFSRRLWNCEEARGLLATFSWRRTFSAKGYKPTSNGDLGPEPVERMIYRAKPSVLRSYRSFETIASSAEDLAVVEEAMARAGLIAGQSRRNDLGRAALPQSAVPTIHRWPALQGKNANGPQPQVSTPEDCDPFNDDANDSATSS